MLAAGAVVATLGVTLVPAQATPYAGQFAYLTTGTVSIVGADGARWLLSVGATSDDGVSNRTERNLYIDLSRCTGSTCVAKGRWVRALTPAEITLKSTGNVHVVQTEQGTGTVRTVLGDRDLRIDLREGGVGGGSFTGVNSSTTPPGIAPQLHDWRYAAGTLRLGGMTCKVGVRGTEAVIGSVMVVDTLGDDARDPRTAPPAQMPAGFLSGKHKVHC